MEPAELAGLLAREVDTGIAIALSSVEAVGMLTVERVTARVGAAPEGQDVDWSQVTWQSEVVLHVEPGRRQAASGEPVAQGATVPEVVAALPARALLGVGAVWEGQLARAGILTVGQLASLDSSALAQLVDEHGAYAAELAARARQLPAVWPTDPGRVVGSRSVLEVVRAGPQLLDGTDRVAAAATWEACLRLAACLDVDVLAALPARGLT